MNIKFVGRPHPSLALGHAARVLMSTRIGAVEISAKFNQVFGGQDMAPRTEYSWALTNNLEYLIRSGRAGEAARRVNPYTCTPGDIRAVWDLRANDLWTLLNAYRF